MEMGGDGFIHYRRSENSFDPEFLVKITALDILPGFADAFMLSAVLSILTKLVAHKSIQIKTMEWELSSDGLSDDEIEMAGMIINDSVETNTFRVEEHVFLERNHAAFNSIVMGSMNRDLGLKSFRRLGIIIDGEHLVPEAAHESVKKMDDGVTRYRTTLLMKDTFPTQVALMHKSFEILKMHYEKDCPSRATYRSVYNKYENEQVKRKVENDGLVTYITETKCGCTVQRTYALHEKDYMEEVDETEIDKECPITKKVYRWIQENKITQKPTVAKGIEKPAATKKDTVTQEATVTIIPTVTEEVKGPEVTEEVKEPPTNQESTVTQHQEAVESPSLLKYLLVLIVIPIALAIIFAFF
ncbi:hypothetical protein CAEBREN_12968 [Caenorhabditis brenneri]|uniref:Uncharacterized protein n=1 Tax=Caenorhabditis brenneri TaxID=135651 RepID=G0NIA0_CAEBE|nr:hypothetical protein CAEBREN_12968 [Caenorhabditis brenneri]